MVGVFAGHGRDVTDVDCSGDSERLISSSMDKQVLLWDVENTTIMRRFRGHAGQVNCVKMHEECTLAVSGMGRLYDLILVQLFGEGLFRNKKEFTVKLNKFREYKSNFILRVCE